MSYYKLIWKSNLGFTIFGMIFITFFQFLILYLVTTFDTQAILVSVLKQMPPPMRAFLDQSFFSLLTFNGAAAFGFNHPLVLALLAIIAISIPVRHISREIENGTLEMLLSHPFSRKRLVLKLWTSSVFILGIIILVSFFGSIAAIEIFHELSNEVFIKILIIAFNLWLLFILIMSYTLFIASVSRGGGFSGSLSAMITFIFYLLFFLGELWVVMKPTLPFNIFNYFQPQKIMLGQADYWRDGGVLLATGAIMLIITLFKFQRRDIP
ncbi:MAG: ABC transporter permease [Bacteroidales bacterium]|nr:ABC transporter permease [Bacteroidales bacterium]